ncbi:MAG TPA: hypothetical protein VJ718_02890, partial [Candidatus Binataceae bacterium]|nr:hypothetical protein [Candidatus Binataceae bacterium]
MNGRFALATADASGLAIPLASVELSKRAASVDAAAPPVTMIWSDRWYCRSVDWAQPYIGNSISATRKIFCVLPRIQRAKPSPIRRLPYPPTRFEATHHPLKKLMLTNGYKQRLPSYRQLGDRHDGREFKKLSCGRDI